MTTETQEAPQVKPDASQVTAAWKDWSKKFLDRGVSIEPMDMNTAMAFFNCSMGEKDESFPPEAVKASFLYRVGEKRAQYAGLVITPACLSLLCYLCESPGTMVMYIHALRYLQMRDKVESIGMNELARQFPMGFPTQEALSTLWDAKKGYVLGWKLDNMLDSVQTRTVV